MPPSLNNFSVCVPFYGSAFECHWPGSGGDGWNYWSERNKAVTFIALSDLLRHQGNKQKAKLIVPDHIRPVTPPPDPTGTTALFCFPHALCLFRQPQIFWPKNKQSEGPGLAWSSRCGNQICGMTNQVISYWGIQTGGPTVRWVNEAHLARLRNIQTLPKSHQRVPKLPESNCTMPCVFQEPPFSELVKSHTQVMPTRHGLCVIVTKLRK